VTYNETHLMNVGITSQQGQSSRLFQRLGIPRQLGLGRMPPWVSEGKLVGPLYHYGIHITLGMLNTTSGHHHTPQRTKNQDKQRGEQPRSETSKLFRVDAKAIRKHSYRNRLWHTTVKTLAGRENREERAPCTTTRCKPQTSQSDFEVSGPRPVPPS